MPVTIALTPAMAIALADAVRQGVPLETAAQAAGIGERTLYEWVSAANNGRWSNGAPLVGETKDRLTQFSQQMAQAQADFEAKRVQNIARAAEIANEKTGQRDWRADAWLLNNHPRYRKRYRQENHLQVDQHTTITLERQLVDQAIESGGLAALDALEAQLPALPPGLEG